MAGLIIVDNTVLTNFALINRPDLFDLLWSGRATSTNEVLEEYQAGAAGGKLPQNEWEQLTILSLNTRETQFADFLSCRLGSGERSCIALCRFRDGIFLSDDHDARMAAQSYNIPVSGTIGVLVLAANKALIDLNTANRCLQQMINAGYRSPIDSLDGILPE